MIIVRVSIGDKIRPSTLLMAVLINISIRKVTKSVGGNLLFRIISIERWLVKEEERRGWREGGEGWSYSIRGEHQPIEKWK